MPLAELAERLLNALCSEYSSFGFRAPLHLVTLRLAVDGRLGPALRSEAPDRAAGAAVLLAELAERLLSAFAAAVADAGAAGGEGLRAEYAAARAEVLQALLEEALRFEEQGMLEKSRVYRNSFGVGGVQANSA